MKKENHINLTKQKYLCITSFHFMNQSNQLSIKVPSVPPENTNIIMAAAEMAVLSLQ